MCLMPPSLFRTVVIIAAFALPVGLRVSEARPPEPPNIVLFLSDDHDIFYASFYGHERVRTPNMDRLAREGMVFNRAFTATAMCAPSRSMLYTGLYPHRNGAHPNHSEVRPGVRSLPHFLGALGYRVALAGKRHVGPREAFPFEYRAFGEVDEFLAGVGEEPFCLIIASDEPHTPHASGGYTPGEVVLPPYFVDTPETRARTADYLTDIDLLDQEIGHALDLLERHGLEENTLFVYASDHGGPLPFGKWTLYDSGLNVPFVARWPGKVPPGVSTEAMISFVDVLPTFIEVAGGRPPADLDGRSFLPVLMGETDAHRNVVFGTHTNEGIRNGGPYPIRAVRTLTHKYILNINHHRTFTNNITESGAYSELPVNARDLYRAGEGFGPMWNSWLERARRDTAAAQRTLLYQHRPSEELYDLRTDPHEMKNLAFGPDQQDLRIRLRKMLMQWMQQQRDPMFEELEDQKTGTAGGE